MTLWIVLIVVVLCICALIFSGRKDSCLKGRETVDTAYWQQFIDSKKLKCDKKRLLSVLNILGSAFGSNPLKLKYDDDLRMFDQSSKVGACIFGDSLLDAALEELVCENLLPKTIKKTDFSTIGDIVIYSMEET
jgi:hypothetical protein